MQNFLLQNMMKLPAVQTRTALDREFLTVSTQEGADEFLRQMRNDGKPPFSRDILVTINQRIHNEPKDFIEHKNLMKNDADYARDPSEWWKNSLIGLYWTMSTICAFASKDLLKEAVTDIELRMILNHLVSMMKLSISRGNRGVKITEEMLISTKFYITLAFDLKAGDEMIKDFLKSVASVMKRTKVSPPLDSGVGHVLSYYMVECFFHIALQKGNETEGFSFIYESGILEQVLRHIHLPWTHGVHDDNEHMVRLRKFLSLLATSTISLRKIFREESRCRQVLLDILEGRIRPCQQNEHALELLQTLKKFRDMGSLGTFDAKFSDKFERSGGRCGYCGNMGDCNQKFLSCGECKGVQYCSRECQKADWKVHKGWCGIYKSIKFKNLSEVTNNFSREHRSLLTERVRNKCRETGFESTHFIIDLDFTDASGPVPPALRNPPEFEVLPASIFWNREEDKAPPNHWFFRDKGNGTTLYSDSDIVRIRKDADSKQKDYSKLGQGVVFFLHNFAEHQFLSGGPIDMYDEYEMKKINLVRKRMDEFIKRTENCQHWKALPQSKKSFVLNTMENVLGAMPDLMEKLNMKAHVCTKCNKFEADEMLFICENCDQVHYCSQECQEADRDNHLITCVPQTDKTNLQFDVLNKSVIGNRA